MAATLQPIPKPPGHLFVGNLFDLDAHNSMESMTALAREYGPIYQLELPGGNSRVVVSGVDLVDQLCDESHFDKMLAGPAGAERRPGRARPVHLGDRRSALAQGAQHPPPRVQSGRDARLPPDDARHRGAAHAEVGAAQLR